MSYNIIIILNIKFNISLILLWLNIICKVCGIKFVTNLILFLIHPYLI